MNGISDFDKTVGRIAGAIFTDITNKFEHPPLMLVPGFTFKVRKLLEPISDVKLLSKKQKVELAKDIQLAIIPVLSTYDIDAVVIKEITPVIEEAALKALDQS